MDEPITVIIGPFKRSLKGDMGRRSQRGFTVVAIAKKLLELSCCRSDIWRRDQGNEKAGFRFGWLSRLAINHR
jgi:hypothetical protein